MFLSEPSLICMASYEPATRAPDSISTDAVYELLSDSTRRNLLAVLASHDRTMTLSTLTTEVCAREHDIPRTDISEEQRSRTVTALHHNHLPRLAEHGVIAYETNQQLATPGEALAQIEPFLPSPVEDQSVR